MACVFCHRRERSSGNTYLCSMCVQKLLCLSEEQVVKAYRLSVEQKYHEKALVLEQFIKEDEHYVRETKETGRDLVRTRPLSKTRFTRDEIRT
jgi:hypothetical protein